MLPAASDLPDERGRKAQPQSCRRRRLEHLPARPCLSHFSTLPVAILAGLGPVSSGGRSSIGVPRKSFSETLIAPRFGSQTKARSVHDRQAGSGSGSGAFRWYAASGKVAHASSGILDLAKSRTPRQSEEERRDVGGGLGRVVMRCAIFFGGGWFSPLPPLQPRSAQK